MFFGPTMGLGKKRSNIAFLRWVAWSAKNIY